MIKIYLASRYSRREEMERYARELEVLGYGITSRWVNGNHTSGPHPDMNDPINRRLAENDRNDVLAADLVISFTETELFPRNSRHCEFQIAYEHGKICYLVGPYENIFHWLPGVKRFNNWQDLTEHLKDLVSVAA
jgi:hypothetical protein